MISTKHTPVPWTADKLQDRDTFNIFAKGFASAMCQVSVMANADRLVTGAEVEANARLISAAPDLLEAAKLVIAWYEAEDDHSKADFYERLQMCRDSEAALRAAIAKATGQKGGA